MNKKEKMYQRIEQHGQQLNALFNTAVGNVELCKKLRKIEKSLEKPLLDACNVGMDYDELDKITDSALDNVDKLLNFRENKIPVFVNRDPRGYALKIKDDFVREYNHQNSSLGARIYTDWGGYGILAPDLS